MNKRYNIPFIIVIALLAIATILFLLVKKPQAETPAVVRADTVHYFCTEGTINAVFEESSATLVLGGNRTLSLPQVRSGSGIRYEKDGVVFVSKGSSAYLEENGVGTYNNCVENAAPVNTSSGGKTKQFADQGKTVSFSYPAELSVSGGEIGYVSSWRANTATLGLVLAKVTIPKTSQPQTNLSDSWFSIGTSSDPVALKECLVATNGEYASGTVTLNGTAYSVFTLGDAGAGNYYDTTSYRTIRNSQCYAVEYTIHSTSLGAYSPDQGIKAFDKQKVIETFESIVHSVRFIQ